MTDAIDGWPDEPPEDRLPWWAAGTCDLCLEPVDVLELDERGNKFCGRCHPDSTPGLLPGIHGASADREAEVCMHSTGSDFGRPQDIPF